MRRSAEAKRRVKDAWGCHGCGPEMGRLKADGLAERVRSEDGEWQAERREHCGLVARVGHGPGAGVVDGILLGVVTGAGHARGCRCRRGLGAADVAQVRQGNHPGKHAEAPVQDLALFWGVTGSVVSGQAATSS